MDLDTVATTELDALNQISQKLSVIDTWVAFIAYGMCIMVCFYVAFRLGKWLITGPITALMRKAFNNI